MNLITKKKLIAPEQRKSAIQLHKCDFQSRQNFNASTAAFHVKIFNHYSQN